MKKPKKRLTVGLLMILVAISAVGLWAFEYSRKTRVTFGNRSAFRVRDVTATYAGRTVHLGPVEAGQRLQQRIATPPGEPVRIAFDVQRRAGGPEDHIQAPGMIPAGAGGQVLVEWSGP